MPLTPGGVDIPTSFDPSKVPLQSPPAGVIPNFAHPESRCWQAYLTAALCLTLAISFVVLRVYSKFVVTRLRTADDCTTIFYRPELGYLVC